MEQDTKNKHRISDARWRDSVSRCYNLLKQCTNEQDPTRQSILRSIHDQIQSYEKLFKDSGCLDLVQKVFEEGEAFAMQHQQNP